MNAFDDDERALSRTLHGKVDQMNDAPLGLGQVQGAARAVRRRRRIAAGAGLAAAAVIVVPTAIIAAGGLDRGTDGPPPATGSATPDPTQSASEPATPQPRTAPFDVTDLPTGAAPAIEWLDKRDIHLADGTSQAGLFPMGVWAFAPMGSGWMVASGTDDDADTVQWVSPAGDLGEAYPIDGDLATSPEGDVVGWAEPDGYVRVVQLEGDEVFTMARIEAEGPYDAVAVTTEDCKEGRSTPEGCAVLVNTRGEEPQSFTSASHGFSDVLDDEIKQLTAWSEGAYAGITEFRDDLTTCSAVRAWSTDAKTLWETCDNRLLDFSPSGTHLLGVGSVGDGFGDGQVSILDAADGTVLVDLRSDEEHQTSVVQMAWEDDSHVLMVTYADGAWAIVRLGLDGSMEYAVPPREGDQFERPFFLQS
jgi:hypothetical protein